MVSLESTMWYLKLWRTIRCVDLACFFFVMAGSHNEINVLQRSLSFGGHVEGHAPTIN
jgi:hypothetical protein